LALNNPFVLSGAAIGFVLALSYFWVRLKNGLERNIEDVIAVFGYGVGLCGGAQVCWTSFLYRAASPIDSISLQMFAGGFALGLFAINGICRKFQAE